MAAVVAAIHHHEDRNGGRPGKERNGPQNGTGLATVSPFGSTTTEEDAALVIQRAAFPRLIAPHRTGARALPVLRKCKYALVCLLSVDGTNRRACDGRAETQGASRTPGARAGPAGR